MVKNVFNFALKPLFVLKIFKFLEIFKFMQEKGLDEKDMVNFEIYDVIILFTNNCNIYIAQYLTK